MFERSNKSLNRVVVPTRPLRDGPAREAAAAGRAGPRPGGTRDPGYSISVTHHPAGRDRHDRADSRLVMTALACGQGAGHGGRFQLYAGTGARARWSWAREWIPSLRNTLFRW